MLVDLLLVATTARLTHVAAFLGHGLRCNFSHVIVMLDIKIPPKVFGPDEGE